MAQTTREDSWSMFLGNPGQAEIVTVQPPKPPEEIPEDSTDGTVQISIDYTSDKDPKCCTAS